MNWEVSLLSWFRPYVLLMFEWIKNRIIGMLFYVFCYWFSVWLCLWGVQYLLNLLMLMQTVHCILMIDIRMLLCCMYDCGRGSANSNMMKFLMGWMSWRMNISRTRNYLCYNAFLVERCMRCGVSLLFWYLCLSEFACLCICVESLISLLSSWTFLLFFLWFFVLIWFFLLFKCFEMCMWNFYCTWCE